MNNSYTVDWGVVKIDVSGDLTYEEARAMCLALAVAAGYRVPRWWEFWRWLEKRHDLESTIAWFFNELKQEREYEVQEIQGPEGPGDPVG